MVRAGGPQLRGRFRSGRWRSGERAAASAPARVPKVVFSFLLFSTPNCPRWSLGFLFHPTSVDNLRTSAAAAATI